MALTLHPATTAPGPLDDQPVLEGPNCLEQMVPLGTDRCAYIYYRSTTDLTYIRVVNVSGVAVTSIGPEQQLDFPSSRFLCTSAICPLNDDTFFIVSGTLSGSDTIIRARAYSVSGNAVIAGTERDLFTIPGPIY